MARPPHHRYAGAPRCPGPGDSGTAALVAADIAGEESRAGPHQAGRGAAFQEPMLHAELFSSIRFAAGWHDACEEGLAPATLAVEPPMRPVFQAMRRPALMGAFNRLGAASMLGWRSATLPIRLSPGLCLIVIPSTARSDVLAGGRALQRVWLEATLAGLSVQPYAAAGVIGLGLVPIEPALQPSLARLGSALRELCAPGCGLVFLRLGYARSAVRHRSGRRALASFGDFQ